jgi:hypothetical protein
MTYPVRPPLVTGEDGLPHCGWCINETELLCDFHRKQVGAELNHLRTANTLARSDWDLRYIVKKRSRATEEA